MPRTPGASTPAMIAATAASSDDCNCRIRSSASAPTRADHSGGIRGLAIGATMTADSFLNFQTLGILALGLLAFVMDTVAGLLFGKLMCVLSGWKINPLIGACGISAFPMAGRLSAKMAQEEDYENFILMHAMGANTAGQLGSVIAGGLLLALVNAMH